MIRRLFLFIIGAAVAIAATVACDPAVTSGVVVRKDYQPAFTVMQYQCYKYDSATGACSFGILTPYTYPPEYDICMRDNTVDKPVDQQPWGCVSVTEVDYERYHAGDHYP